LPLRSPDRVILLMHLPLAESISFASSEREPLRQIITIIQSALIFSGDPPLIEYLISRYCLLGNGLLLVYKSWSDNPKFIRIVKQY